MAADQGSKQSHWPLSVLGGVTSVLNVFLPLSLVRVLTPEEIGQYKLLFFYITMIPLMSLTVGVTNGLFYWAGRRNKREAAFRSSWNIVLSAGIFILALGILLNGKMVEHLHWTQTEAWLFVWTGFLTVISSFYEDSKVARGEIWRGGLFGSGFEFVRNLAIIVAALRFRTIDSVMWTYAVVMTFKAVAGVILGYIQGTQRLVWDRQSWKEVITYAAPVSVAGLLSVCTGYGDQVILSLLLTAAQFGVYSLGCLTVPPLTIVEISVNRVLIPNMASAFSAERSDDARALYRESVSELAWVLIPASIALSLFAYPIVLLLFREKFIAAAPYLRIYAFSYLALLIPYDAVARARGDGKWILKFLAIFSPISITAIYVGALTHGAMGALVGLICGQYLMRAASLAWVSRTEHWKLSEMLPWGDFSRYLGASVLGVFASLVIKRWVSEPLLWFAAGGSAYSVIYLLGTASLLLKRSGRATMPKPMLSFARLLSKLTF